MAKAARNTTLVGVQALATLACSSKAETSNSSSIEPQLSAIEQQVFHPSCTFSSCHSADTAKQGLNLSGSTYAALVNQPSTEVTGRLLVIPSDPDNSYLLEKLTRDSPASGSRMPYTSSPLSEDKIAAIRSWIELGAKQD